MGRVTTRVRRTRLDVDTGGRVDRTDTVAVEEPLEIGIGDEPLTTTMRTPGDDFDLTIGHLLTEAMLHSAAEVGTLMHCTDLDEEGSSTFNVVEVTLAPGATLHRAARERTETISSACGVCGSATIDAVRTSSRYAVSEDAVVVSPQVLAGLPEALRARQPVFDRTGGVHAAALASPDGELLVVREDVGRHNAVDKVVGAVPRPRAALQRNRPRRDAPATSRSCRRRASPASRWSWRWGPRARSRWSSRPRPASPSSRSRDPRTCPSTAALTGCSAGRDAGTGE